MPLLVHAAVHREGRFWVIDVPSVGIVAQALRWADVRPTAQDCAAMVLDVPFERVRIGAVRREPEGDEGY